MHDNGWDGPRSFGSLLCRDRLKTASVVAPFNLNQSHKTRCKFEPRIEGSVSSLLYSHTYSVQLATHVRLQQKLYHKSKRRQLKAFIHLMPFVVAWQTEQRQDVNICWLLWEHDKVTHWLSHRTLARTLSLWKTQSSLLTGSSCHTSKVKGHLLGPPQLASAKRKHKTLKIQNIYFWKCLYKRREKKKSEPNRKTQYKLFGY